MRRKLSALSSLFDDLRTRGAVEGNPVRGIERPAEEGDTNAAPVLSGEQARRLLDAPPEGTIKGLRDRAILAVLLCQGLTREELCGLRAGDLILLDGEPHIRVRGNRGPDPDRRPASRRHAAHRPPISTGPAMVGTRPTRCSARWPTIAAGGKLDRALDPGSVYRHVVCYHADRSGLSREVEGLCAHSLRATAAATALGEGARPEAVRDWLGHTNLAATVLYYRPPASDSISPTLRISYPKPGPVQESGDPPSFSAGAMSRDGAA